MIRILNKVVFFELSNNQFFVSMLEISINRNFISFRGISIFFVLQ